MSFNKPNFRIKKSTTYRKNNKKKRKRRNNFQKKTTKKRSKKTRNYKSLSDYEQSQKIIKKKSQPGWIIQQVGGEIPEKFNDLPFVTSRNKWYNKFNWNEPTGNDKKILQRGAAFLSFLKHRHNVKTLRSEDFSSQRITSFFNEFKHNKKGSYMGIYGGTIFEWNYSIHQVASRGFDFAIKKNSNYVDTNVDQCLKKTKNFAPTPVGSRPYKPRTIQAIWKHLGESGDDLLRKMIFLTPIITPIRDTDLDRFAFNREVMDPETEEISIEQLFWDKKDEGVLVFKLYTSKTGFTYHRICDTDVDENSSDPEGDEMYNLYRLYRKYLNTFGKTAETRAKNMIGGFYRFPQKSRFPGSPDFHPLKNRVKTAQFKGIVRSVEEQFLNTFDDDVIKEQQTGKKVPSHERQFESEAVGLNQFTLKGRRSFYAKSTGGNKNYPDEYFMDGHWKSKKSYAIHYKRLNSNIRETERQQATIKIQREEFGRKSYKEVKNVIKKRKERKLQPQITQTQNQSSYQYPQQMPFYYPQQPFYSPQKNIANPGYFHPNSGYFHQRQFPPFIPNNPGTSTNFGASLSRKQTQRSNTTDEELLKNEDIIDYEDNNEFTLDSMHNFDDTALSELSAPPLFKEDKQPTRKQKRNKPVKGSINIQHYVSRFLV